MLILLLSSWPSTAKFFGKRVKADKIEDGAPSKTSGDEKDDAITNAKRLIDRLQDATYPAVSSRNKEKNPATCDSIMAKSLVEANEEKAAIASQLDEIVKAASILSTKVDDLTTSLDAANEEIITLGNKLEEKSETTNNALSKEREASKLKMDALQNTTSEKIAELEHTIANIKAKHMEEMTYKVSQLEEDLERTKAKHIEEMTSIEEKHNIIINEMREDVEGKMSSCMAKSDMDREGIMKDATLQIEEAKARARHDVERMAKEFNDKHDKDIAEKSDLLSKHAVKIDEMKALVEKQTMEAENNMKAAIAAKDAMLLEERQKNKDLSESVKAITIKLDNEKKKLHENLELVRTSSVKLEKEVSYWKETHENQGYCNVTLLRQDSRRLVQKALDGASEGLETSKQYASRGLETSYEFLTTKMEMLQQMSVNAMIVGHEMFVRHLDVLEKTWLEVKGHMKEKVLPTVENAVVDAHKKASLLYEKHLEVHVNTHLVPIYNEKISPVYNEKIYPVYDETILPVYMMHVSPVIKQMKILTKDLIEISHDGIKKVHSKAATFAQETSIAVLEKNKTKDVLPPWLVDIVSHASSDGEWAVNNLFGGIAILIFIALRSYVRYFLFRMIGFIFSVVWFFCPLRFCVGGRPKNVAKESEMKSTPKNGRKSATNGKEKATGKNGNGKVNAKIE
jgi:hypothetical protein